MVRLSKICDILRNLLQFQAATYHIRVIMDIFYIAFNFIVTGHFLACMWYWMGRAAPTDTGWRWLNPLEGRNELRTHT